MDKLSTALQRRALQLGLDTSGKTNEMLIDEITSYISLDQRIAQATNEPTGFDLRQEALPNKGILEFCSRPNFVRRIKNGDTEYEEVTRFGEGHPEFDTNEDPTIGGFYFYPNSSEVPIKIWHHGVIHSFYQPLYLETSPEDSYIVYFDGHSLKNALPSEARTVFDEHASIALTQFLAPTSPTCCLFASERHGIRMDGTTHGRLHNTIGTTFQSGAEFLSLSLGQSTFGGIDETVLYDEDLRLAHSAKTTLPFVYLLADGWHLTEPDNQVALLLEGVAQRNDIATTSLIPLAGGQYGLTHIIATNDPRTPYVKVLGQAVHTNANNARLAAREEMFKLVIEDVPTAEFRALYSIIHSSSGLITNTGTTPITHIDFRRVLRSL